ncbi:MAG: anti-sigma factor [Chloroflexi bacterium]|nr:anti-sigma factor [Chloroflexota bacterium]
MKGFLGTDASLIADFNLVIHILMFIVLCLGVTAQLGRKYHWHDRFQIPVVVLNILLILFIMLPSYLTIAPDVPANLTKSFFLVPTIHVIVGLLAQGVATYCLLAGLKILPRKIGMLRIWMWIAFVLWTIATLLGIGIYPVEEHAEAPVDLVQEHAAEPAVVAAEPTATPEPPTPTPIPTPVRVGLLTVSDDQAHSDKVTLTLAGVTPPPDGSVYEAWLEGEGQPPFSIGKLTLSGDAVNHTFTDPDGRNLLELYNSMFISVEPANDSDPAPSEVKAYQGEVSLPVME